LDDTPSPAHRDQLEHRLLAAYAQRRFSDQKKHVWRTIMKSKLTKLAAAAVALIVIGLGLYTHQGRINIVTPAYAIEQTIEALQNVEVVRIELEAHPDEPEHSDLLVDAILWAKPNADETRSGTLRQEVWYEGTLNSIRIYDEQKNETYSYHPSEHIVYLASGNKVMHGIDPWLGKNFFQMILDKLNNVKPEEGDFNISRETDPETGQNCLILKIRLFVNSRSLWIQIDPKTKLPVSIRQWGHNANFEGEPDVNINNITYNPELPEEIFDFVIPEGAKVVDERTTTGAGQK
jgi:hypothetical protein